MFNMLLNNLLLITVLVIMYLGSLVLNTVLGTYHNISNLKEHFSKEKLISGTIRGLITLAGALGITAMISLLPGILAAFGISADASVVEGLSVAAMAGIMGSTVVRYLGDALKKFYTILGYNKEEA